MKGFVVSFNPLFIGSRFVTEGENANCSHPAEFQSPIHRV